MLLLLLLVKGIALSVVPASAKGASHLVEFFLFRGGNTMRVRRLQCFGVLKESASFSEQLRAKFVDLLFDFILIQPNTGCKLNV